MLRIVLALCLAIAALAAPVAASATPGGCNSKQPPVGES